MTKKIGFLLGSLRKDSFSSRIAKTISDLFLEGYIGELIEISHLPFYNEDLDKNQTPKSYQDFRSKIEDLDGIIFITPEYNRTFPAVLKNAIDVASRPYNVQKWAGKKVAVVSQSPSSLGGILANWDLRKPLRFLGADLLAQPEMAFSSVANNFDNQGNPTEKTKEFVQSFVDAFIFHIG